MHVLVPRFISHIYKECRLANKYGDVRRTQFWRSRSVANSTQRKLERGNLPPILWSPYTPRALRCHDNCLFSLARTKSFWRGLTRHKFRLHSFLLKNHSLRKEEVSQNVCPTKRLHFAHLPRTLRSAQSCQTSLSIFTVTESGHRTQEQIP